MKDLGAELKQILIQSETQLRFLETVQSDEDDFLEAAMEVFDNCAETFEDHFQRIIPDLISSGLKLASLPELAKVIKLDELTAFLQKSTDHFPTLLLLLREQANWDTEWPSLLSEVRAHFIREPITKSSNENAFRLALDSFSSLIESHFMDFSSKEWAELHDATKALRTSSHATSQDLLGISTIESYCRESFDKHFSPWISPAPIYAGSSAGLETEFLAWLKKYHYRDPHNIFEEEEFDLDELENESENLEPLKMAWFNFSDPFPSSHNGYLWEFSEVLIPLDSDEETIDLACKLIPNPAPWIEKLPVNFEDHFMLLLVRTGERSEYESTLDVVKLHSWRDTLVSLENLNPDDISLGILWIRLQEIESTE